MLQGRACPTDMPFRGHHALWLDARCRLRTAALPLPTSALKRTPHTRVRTRARPLPTSCAPQHSHMPGLSCTPPTRAFRRIAPCADAAPT
eukprot:358841-Chlamydomonas_euryale.AAC.5